MQQEEVERHKKWEDFLEALVSRTQLLGLRGAESEEPTGLQALEYLRTSGDSRFCGCHACSPTSHLESVFGAGRDRRRTLILVTKPTHGRVVHDRSQHG